MAVHYSHSHALHRTRNNRASRFYSTLSRRKTYDTPLHFHRSRLLTTRNPMIMRPLARSLRYSTIMCYA